MHRPLPWLAGLLLAISTPALAQNHLQPVAPPAMLTLTATAEVMRAPDQARLTAGVLTTAATAAEAMAANAARMNGVLAALKAAGVSARDVQTTGLNTIRNIVMCRNRHLFSPVIRPATASVCAPRGWMMPAN